MSVDFNTPIEKLLHKTRSFLRATETTNGKDKKATISRNVKGDGYTLAVKLMAGGKITVKAKVGDFEAEATLYNGGKLEYNGRVKRTKRIGELTPSIKMPDREIHYTLRTCLKNGIPGWQSHRAPIRKLREPRGYW